MLTKNHQTQHPHYCNAIVFVCIDWRLHPKIEADFKKKYGRFDLCATAGSIKGFFDPEIKKFLLKQIEISHKLHHTKTVVLTFHRDCGAYGGSSSFADRDDEKRRAKIELNKAEKIISKKFPQLKIIKQFIELEGKNIKIIKNI
ncbi:MAG: carbonic anhydrase [Patescibacteria group bacterium]